MIWSLLKIGFLASLTVLLVCIEIYLVFGERDVVKGVIVGFGIVLCIDKIKEEVCELGF